MKLRVLMMAMILAVFAFCAGVVCADDDNLGAGTSTSKKEAVINENTGDEITTKNNSNTNGNSNMHGNRGARPLTPEERAVMRGDRFMGTDSAHPRRSR